MTEPPPNPSAAKAPAGRPARSRACGAGELAGRRVSAQTAVADAGRRGRRAWAITLERPPRADFGDYSTNAALLLAPGLGTSPREVAERLGRRSGTRLGPSLERFEVAGPGFLNLFLADCLVRRRRSPRRSPPGRRSVPVAPQRPSASWWNSSRPTRRGRCTSGMPATPPTATRSRGCSPSTATRSSASSTSTTPARRCASSASRFRRWRGARRSPQDGYRGDIRRASSCTWWSGLDMDPAELGRAAVTRHGGRRCRHRSPRSACRASIAGLMRAPCTRAIRAR